MLHLKTVHISMNALINTGNGLEERIQRISDSAERKFRCNCRSPQENFIEMRDLVADKRFLLKKKIESSLYKNFPMFSFLNIQWLLL